MKRRLFGERAVTFVLNAMLLRRTIGYLRPRPDERATLLSGFRLAGGLCVCTHFSRSIRYDEQSPVFLHTEVVSYLHALREIHDEGMEILLYAHSHPGAGAFATQPSGIDWRYLSDVQLKVGSRAIGLIITADGHVRFYSPHMRFKLILKGSGLTTIDHEEHIYHVAPLPRKTLALALGAEASSDADDQAYAIVV